MKKRLCSILLFAAMMVTLLPVCFAAGTVPQYSDVPETHWAYSAIQICSQRAWFGGYPDGTFGPERLIQRDEAAKVFAQALGLTVEENPTLSFTDTADNWARGYIEATKSLFPNTANFQGTLSFRPEQTITREETVYALVVAWRYASRTINADQSVLDMFSDAYSISAGVKPYVAVAVQEGLVAGLPDGTIGAQKGLTRAEFATLLARALNHGYGPDKTETPVITLDHYPAVTAAETVTLSGRVSPVTPGLRLTVNGDSLTLTDTGAFQTPVPLAQGTNTFTITAETLYGLQTTQTLTIERRADTVGISFLTTIPAETQADRCTVRGQVENDSPDCVLLLDNSMVKTDAQGQFEAELVLQQGKNIFRFTVIRQNQEVAVQEVTIIRKAVAPTVLSSSLGVVTAKNATKITISGAGTLTLADNEVYGAASVGDVAVVSSMRTDTGTYYHVERAETVTGTLTAYKNRSNVIIDSTTYSFYKDTLFTAGLENAVSDFTSDHIGETFTLYFIDGYVGAAVWNAGSVSIPEETGGQVYGIVSSYNGTVKIDDDTYKQYVVDMNSETYTLNVPHNSDKLYTGALVSFEAVSDDRYVDGDITVYDGSAFDSTHGLATWMKEYSASDKIITHYSNLSYTDSAYYTGSDLKAYALDKDCAIVYVDIDEKRAGNEIGISQFDTVTGYRNVLLVKNESTDQVAAIFVETSGECDILPAR